MQFSSQSLISGSWLRRFGLTGFVFFLAKGLLWLSLPLLARLFTGG